MLACGWLRSQVSQMANRWMDSTRPRTETNRLGWEDPGQANRACVNKVCLD